LYKFNEKSVWMAEKHNITMGCLLNVETLKLDKMSNARASAFKMVSMDEALESIWNETPLLPSTNLDVTNSAGLFAAEDVFAKGN